MNGDNQLDAILEQRGSRYGLFKHHAALTQELKRVFYKHMSEFNDESLRPSQQEAIDMIMHKLGRIGNGDPNYADSWIDIAGYAQLVANELVGKTK
jgi:hypothetical protein